jgi:hypothetical protein
MAVLKEDTYNGFTVITGDDEIDSDGGEQLKISAKELKAAINAENLTDQIFGRVLRNRSKMHQALMEKIPGADK